MRTHTKLKCMSVQVTESLAKIIQEYLKQDSYVSVSDFLRACIKEKLQRDTPDLYKRLYTPHNEGQQ